MGTSPDRGGGIIPANTGRIYGILTETPQVQDHPREYGENIDIQLGENVTHGSSPRIRGELKTPENSDTHSGIIPANTGRISLNGLILFRVRDHPREYGENHVSHVHAYGRKGSSPRIRGE